MERLTLPEPARTLLRSAAPALIATLDEICEGRRPWALGGGTVLAARWRHRKSNDLDIFVPEENSIETLREEVNPKFRRAMEKCGAQGISEGEKSIKFWMPTGRIEISRLNARPPQEPQWAEVERRPMCVMNNAQIMTGKVRGRWDRSPSRDIFDAAVASQLDPDALGIAINSLATEEQRALTTMLRARERHYRNIAPQEIEGVAEEFKWALETGLDAYVRALSELRAETIAVEKAGGQLRILTVHGNGQWRQKEIEGTRIAKALAELGLTSWAERVGDGQTIAQRIEDKHRERSAQWNERWAATQSTQSSNAGYERIGKSTPGIKKARRGQKTLDQVAARDKARDEAMGPTLIVLEGNEEAVERAKARAKGILGGEMPQL